MSVLSFHPPLGAFGLGSTRVLHPGVGEARLLGAVGDVTPVKLSPAWVSSDTHLPAAVGVTVHVQHKNTSVLQAFVPSSHLFSYMHFKNSSPRLP